VFHALANLPSADHFRFAANAVCAAEQTPGGTEFNLCLRLAARRLTCRTFGAALRRRQGRVGTGRLFIEPAHEPAPKIDRKN
jgi:hypothetical protein